MADDKPFVKREIKNSVFCNLFEDPENQLKLYRYLHPDDTTVVVGDFTTVTIENIFTDQMYNDLGFTVKDRLLVLVEAQATWSINIIPRIIMYYAETLNNYITQTDQNKYGRKKLSIPKPEFYVVYTGTDNKKVKEAYSLAAEFFEGDDSFIDVNVRILKADEEKRDIVTQYIIFTQILAEQEMQYGRSEQAIQETIRICKARNVLKEYLEKREKEVITIMMSLFNQEEAVKAYGKEVAAEAADNTKKENAINMIRGGKLSDADIAQYSGLTISQVQKLREQELVSA